MRAVSFERYGGVEVLEVVDVEDPSPGRGEVLVRVKAAGINPGEASIRKGLLHERWPATFPSGEGSDLAGLVEELGAGVGLFAVGQDVIGWTDRRASHAELVVVEERQLTGRPPNVSWEAAGGLSVAGKTAYAACSAVAPQAGETVAVSGAAGGVGSLAVQLARRTGASVIGIASESNHDWLRDHGVEPISYGDGLERRISDLALNGIDAWIDAFGGGYVDMAASLGVAPARIETIIDFEAAQRHGAKTDGSAAAASAEVLAELAGMIDRGELEVPIARSYPLAEVRAAYEELERRHTRGKIVLVP